MLQTFFGICAIVSSTVCLFPQIIKMIKYKSAKDVSMSMLLLFLASAISWVSYGVYLKDWAILITNIIAGICSISLILFKMHFDKASSKN